MNDYTVVTHHESIGVNLAEHLIVGATVHGLDHLLYKFPMCSNFGNALYEIKCVILSDMFFFSMTLRIHERSIDM